MSFNITVYNDQGDIVLAFDEVHDNIVIDRVEFKNDEVIVLTKTE